MKKLLIFFLGFTCVSWSQDYGEEIERILREFSSLESYSITAQVSMTGDDSYNFTASVKSSEKYGSHIKADISEMLVNDKYAIAIDHEAKEIRVSKGNYKEKDKGKEGYGLENIRQMIDEGLRVEFLGKIEAYRTYVMYSDDMIEKTIVKINNNTGFFHSIEVIYRSEDISISSYKVTYTDFKKNPDFKKSEFNENIVFTEENDKYIPTLLYKGYGIVVEDE